MDTVYDERHPYDGKEFAAVLSALSPRELKRTLKSAYRNEAKKVKQVVVSKAAASGLKHGASVGRSVRTRVYSGGGGFMLTTKSRNGGKYSAGSVSKGFHKNRFGLWKPIALWANAGTSSRYIGDYQGRRVRFGKGSNAQWRTVGASRGSMPAYDFMGKAEAESVRMVERDTYRELTDAAQKQLEKRNIKMG